MKVLQSVRPFVKMMLTDRMDIFRHVSEENEYGAEVTTFPFEPLYRDVPCRCSWSELESPRNTNEDYTPVELPIKIFCAYDTDIKAGDYIFVTRYSGGEVIRTYKGICADVDAHESHRELYFRVQEPA